MGGWYSDAFPSNMARVNTQNIKGSKGNAAVAFGDAFKDIGKLIDQSGTDEKKNKLLDMQIQNEQSKIDQKAEDWVQQQDDKAYLAEAFSRPNMQSFKNNYKVDETNMPSPEAIQQVNQYYKGKEQELQQADIWAQKQFNNEAVQVSSKYDDYKAFAKENPDLIENADGTTIQSIKSSLNTDKAQTAALKHQKVINDLNAKIDKAELKALKKDADKSFKYTQETGSKIRLLVKDKLGMDKDSFVMNDDTSAKFDTMVTEISALSKEYSLEPNLAYDLWIGETEKKEAKNSDPLGLFNK